MSTNAEIISALPPLTWGGLLAPPYALVSFGHENALAERRVPYVDDAIQFIKRLLHRGHSPHAAKQGAAA